MAAPTALPLKRRNQALARDFDLGIKIGDGFGPDNGVKAIDELANGIERLHSSLDGGYRDDVGFGQMIGPIVILRARRSKIFPCTNNGNIANAGESLAPHPFVSVPGLQRLRNSPNRSSRRVL